MKVLHVVPAAFGEKGLVGGAERYALELAKSMANEVQTTLVAFGDRREEYLTGSLKVKILAPTWYVRGQRFNPFSALLIPELLKADVVHCHQQHIFSSGVAALICRLSRRKVFVSDLGGGGWGLSSYFSTDGWFNGHLHISEYSRTVFGHKEKSWAHVIYGGVDTGKFCPNTSIPRNGTALFVGRLLPHKGVDSLVKALPEGMKLEIIGRPYDSRYQQDLLKLAEGKDVIFRHQCNDEDMINSYRRASCIILPSVYRTIYGEETRVPELLGQTLLEGMACGAPAICTDVASMPEVVKDEVTGFVVPPNDPGTLQQKLLWLRDHPQQAAAMGEAGRARVLAEFTWPQVVRRCLKIYQSPQATGEIC